MSTKDSNAAVDTVIGCPYELLRDLGREGCYDLLRKLSEDPATEAKLKNCMLAKLLEDGVKITTGKIILEEGNNG